MDEDDPDELDALEGFDLPDDDGAGWDLPVAGLLEEGWDDE